MDWDRLLEQLGRLHAYFDRQLDACLERVKAQDVTSYCHQGCGNCCTLAVNCSFPEAVVIARSLTSEQCAQLEKKALAVRAIADGAQDLKDYLRRFRAEIGGCAFLDESESCTIYRQRPFSCRALISTRPEAWCGVDFSTLHPLEKQAFLSSLNADIVNFPTHYLAEPQELAADYEAQTSASQFDSSAVTLSGNMLYLVWLEVNFQLTSVIAEGRKLSDFLRLNQLDVPFLLSLCDASVTSS